MALRPTNIYRRLGEEFAYSVSTELDACALRRALLACSSDQQHQQDAPWTAVLRLCPEFGPDDVAVKLDKDARTFWVSAEAASQWQAGDFVRTVRRYVLPGEVSVDSVRCWLEDDVLVLQADWAPPTAAAASSKKPSPVGGEGNKKKSPVAAAAALWPKCRLTDSQQRHGCLVKDKSASGGATTKWTLELGLPEFDSNEVTITRPVDSPARLLIVAKHSVDNGGSSSSSSSVRHEFRREVAPPTGVQLDQLVSRFADNGILRLEAPAPGLRARRSAGFGGGSGGGGSGFAGSKIASLTRELRHHGVHFNGGQRQSAGGRGNGNCALQ